MDKAPLPPNPPASAVQPDTGLASLVLLARLHGLALDPGDIRHRFVYSAGPATESELLKAARAAGLRARCCACRPEELDHLPLPLLAELRDRSWLLVARVATDRILIRDASESRPRIVGRSEFDTRWGGRVLLAARRATA